MDIQNKEVKPTKTPQAITIKEEKKIQDAKRREQKKKKKRERTRERKRVTEQSQ